MPFMQEPCLCEAHRCMPSPWQVFIFQALTFGVGVGGEEKEGMWKSQGSFLLPCGSNPSHQAVQQAPLPAEPPQ